jgi:hypothetical protein
LARRRPSGLNTAANELRGNAIGVLPVPSLLVQNVDNEKYCCGASFVARTAQYHLRKVFTNLGIESRTQIDRVLPY